MSGMGANEALAEGLPPGCSPKNVRAHFDITEQSDPAIEDRVGSGENFGPGTGVDNGSAGDFKVSIWVETDVTVLFMRVFNDGDGQVWSTRIEPESTIMKHAQNPLLILDPSGEPVNTSYVSNFKLQGGVTYTAYAQPEVSSQLTGHSSFDMYLIGCNQVPAKGTREPSLAGQKGAGREFIPSSSGESALNDETRGKLPPPNEGFQSGPGLIGSFRAKPNTQRLPLSSLIRQGQLNNRSAANFPAPLKSHSVSQSLVPSRKAAAKEFPIVQALSSRQKLAEVVLEKSSASVEKLVELKAVKNLAAAPIVKAEEARAGTKAEIKTRKPAVKIQPPPSHVILNCLVDYCP